MKKSPLAMESTSTAIHDFEDDKSEDFDSDTAAELPKPGDTIPPSLVRRLSQEALWGRGSSGAQVERAVREPKRRLTVEQD